MSRPVTWHVYTTYRLPPQTCCAINPSVARVRDHTMFNFCRLSREELVQALTTWGEPLSQEEMVSCMQVLTGSDNILQVLPENVTAGDFACGLLGFDNALDSEPLQISAGA